MKKSNKKWLLISLFLLFIGGTLYLKFRDHTLIMFSWLKYINAEFLFSQMEFDETNAILSFMIYSFPTGVWLMSAIIIFGIIWNENKRTFFAYTFLFCGINIAGETLQLVGLMPGTFDLIDLLTILVFTIAGIAIYLNFIMRRNV